MIPKISLQNASIFLLMLFTLVVVSGCVTAKQKKLDMGASSLSHQELQSLFSKPISGNWVSSSGKTASVQYMPDGVQKISSTRTTDEGTWRIADGTQCSKWKKIRKGAERCTTWFEIAPKKYEVYSTDGALAGEITIN